MDTATPTPSGTKSGWRTWWRITLVLSFLIAQIGLVVIAQNWAIESDYDANIGSHVAAAMLFGALPALVMVSLWSINHGLSVKGIRWQGPKKTTTLPNPSLFDERTVLPKLRHRTRWLYVLVVLVMTGLIPLVVGLLTMGDFSDGLAAGIGVILMALFGWIVGLPLGWCAFLIGYVVCVCFVLLASMIRAFFHRGETTTDRWYILWVASALIGILIALVATGFLCVAIATHLATILHASSRILKWCFVVCGSGWFITPIISIVDSIRKGREKKVVALGELVLMLAISCAVFIGIFKYFDFIVNWRYNG